MGADTGGETGAGAAMRTGAGMGAGAGTGAAAAWREPEPRRADSAHVQPTTSQHRPRHGQPSREFRCLHRQVVMQWWLLWMLQHVTRHWFLFAQSQARGAYDSADGRAWRHTSARG